MNALQDEIERGMRAHPGFREDASLDELLSIAREVDVDASRTRLIDCVCDGEGCMDCDHTGIVEAEAEAELVTLDDVIAEAENEP